MVRVRVSQQDRVDVRQLATHRVQLAEQMVPVPRQARVQERQPASLFDQVAIDQARRKASSTSPDSHPSHPIINQPGQKPTLLLPLPLSPPPSPEGERENNFLAPLPNPLP